MHPGDHIVRYRWWIIAAAFLIVLLSIHFLRKITINPDLESYLPGSMPEKADNDSITALFGASEPLILVFESEDVLNRPTLERIAILTREFRKMKGFRNVISLTGMKTIRGEQGSMVVEPAVTEIPESTADKENLRNKLKNNDLVYKVIVSDDFRYTLIILLSDKTLPDAELMKNVNLKLREVPGSEKVYINGQAYLRDEANRKIGSDILLLLPLGLFIMILFLWFSFREFRGVILPFSVVVFSILISMAFLPVFGWQLSLIGVLIPIMMIAIANNYGVYFIIRYQELNARFPGMSMKEIARETIRFLTTPVTLCGLTTIAGVMGLATHILLPARQLGVVASIGVGFALLLSLTYIPALLSVQKNGKAQHWVSKETADLPTRILEKSAGIIARKPRLVILCFIAFIMFSAAGFKWFRVAPDSNRILPSFHPFNIGLNIIDTHFGGNKLVTLLFDGDMKSPELLKKIDRYETVIKKYPGVGSVTSLATMIRKMSMALNDPADSLYNRIPANREAVAQYLELYNMNGDQEDFNNLVDFGYTKGLMTIQYRTSTLKETGKFVTTLREMMKEDPDMRRIGGYSLIDMKLSESAVDGQYSSLIAAFLAILLLLTFIFRSSIAGLLGCLPLFFAVFCILGIMGWTRIELSIVTALLSSVSIGLGVDFTIHVFWRMMNELKAGEDCRTAVKNMLRATGRGISINAFSVMIGFSVLLLSAFPLIRSFAILIILSLFLCLICALWLIPAICMILHPRFLEPKS